jgi:predicted deacylase
VKPALSEPAPVLELTPPDIAPYRRTNTGIEWVTTLDSGAPGPHVVINALTHGNELCGAVALDALLRMGIRPLTGRLTLSFANVAACRGFDAASPFASRYLDEDFNRLWSPQTLASGRGGRELARARQLRPLFDSADVLLDLHSMTGDSEPLILCGATDRGLRLAESLGFPTWIVADSGHAAGRRIIDYGDFARPDGTRTAILVECGQHWRAATARVALETALRLLVACGQMTAAQAAPHLASATGTPRLVKITHTVTASSAAFTFAAPFGGLEVLPRAGTPIGRDGRHTILTPYDDCVLVMPARRVRPGQTAVRLGRILPPTVVA